MLNLLDPHSLLASLGAAGVFVILFAETGLLVGFFLPGDSLLFTAGLLCAVPQGDPLHLSLPVVLVAAAAGAVLGAQVGYLIGARAGPALLDRADRPRLQGGVARARATLERYGTGKAIVLARFIPVVRTVLNPLAGTVGVPVRSGCRCGCSRCGRWSAAWCGRWASPSPGTCWVAGSPASTPTCAHHRGGHRRVPDPVGPGGPALATPPIGASRAGLTSCPCSPITHLGFLHHDRKPSPTHDLI